MEGKVAAAVGGCALLAGVAYIFQGGNKTKPSRKGQAGFYECKSFLDLFPGLINLGNTCYLNSVLQALASLSTFISWLNSLCKLNENNKRKRLTSELSKFMHILSKPCYEQESYDPVVIFKSLYSHGWIISREQQDAHEIFQVLTSTLGEEEESVTVSTHSLNSILSDKPTLNVSDDSIVHRSRVSASKVQRKSWSPFTGLFANQLTCKTCTKKYPVKFDYFDTISLSFPAPCQFANYTLGDLLNNFLSSEILDCFECENCDQLDKEVTKKSKQKRLIKKLSLGKLPQCLCLHINRTYWHGNGTPYKNNTFVSFSEFLDVGPFVYACCDVDLKLKVPSNLKPMVVPWLDVGGASRKLKEPQEGKRRSSTSCARLTQNSVYHLVAVIVHLGGVHDGHFITYRRTGSSENTSWTLVSDEKVQPVSLTHVLQSNAYMLFYERIRE